MDDRPLAPVVDLAQYRKFRGDARRRIVQAANRIRLARARYVSASMYNREVSPPPLLTMRNLHLAVAIVRHWGTVDDATLAAAGFARRPTPPAASRRRPTLLDAA